jgi:CBS-domain-containing membrane protein/catechol 2,3-dioxygenase-like lactoylglutathione lyase family enzyme
MRAVELMSSPVVTVGPELTTKQAAKTLAENDITTAPVVDENGLLVGIVSEADLTRGEIKPYVRTHLTYRTGRTIPASRRVAEVMTRDVITVPASADAADIAALMLKADIKNVPVVKDNAPVGIVSRRDLLATLTRADESTAAEVTAEPTNDSNGPPPWSVAALTLTGDTTIDEFRVARLLTGTVAGVRRVHAGPAQPLGRRDHPRPASDAGQQRDGSGRSGVREPRGQGARPRLRLASAVMFVRELERSVSFYRELLALEVAVSDNTAALLVSPDGLQLYLRSMGPAAQHPLGQVGIQYLIWTADGEEDLRRCEQVLRARSGYVTRQTVDGFTVVEGRGPDGVPVLVTYPGPDEVPRHQIRPRIYQW